MARLPTVALHDHHPGTPAMTPTQPTQPAPDRQDPFRWDRSDAAGLLDQALRPGDHPSLRCFADQHGVPPSTLRYWKARRDRLDAPKPLRDFFESADGLEFLKGLVLAAHLCFQQTGATGVRPLLAFFEHAGLGPFLACSYGPHQRLAARLRKGAGGDAGVVLGAGAGGGGPGGLDG